MRVCSGVIAGVRRPILSGQLVIRTRQCPQRYCRHRQGRIDFFIRPARLTHSRGCNTCRTSTVANNPADRQARLCRIGWFCSRLCFFSCPARLLILAATAPCSPTIPGERTSTNRQPLQPVLQGIHKSRLPVQKTPDLGYLRLPQLRWYPEARYGRRRAAL